MISAIEHFCETDDTSKLLSQTESQKRLLFKSLQIVKKNIKKVDKYKIYRYFALASVVQPVYLRTHPPTKKLLSYCKYLASLKLDDQYKQSLFYTVYNEMINRGLRVDITNVNKKYLVQLIKVINKVYFSSPTPPLNKYVKVWILPRKIPTPKGDELAERAGECHEYRKKCIYVIYINIDLIKRTFAQHKLQYMNGIIVHNPLECLINLVQHELLHVINFVYCPKDIKKVHHPQIFCNIAYNLFGHTAYYHRLGTDATVIGVTKEELAGRKYVKWIKDDIDDKIIISPIEQLLDHIVLINLDGDIIGIPYRNIYKEEPKV